MAENRKIVKVFLGSPGDLQDERRLAKGVVDEFNKQWADELGYHVELIGWEDTVSGFGRPQEIINRDLERCEYFIGMMYRKWGTVPHNGSGLYTSGFEEEFETSLKRTLATGKPEISLLFKDIEPQFHQDIGPDLQKVLAFQDKIQTEKKVLYQTFANPRDFEARIRGCITSYVQNLRKAELSRASDKGQIGPTEESSGPQLTEEKRSALTNEGAIFIRALLDKAQSKGDLEAVEVARFRLLGSIVHTQLNDERAIGVHDANVLFANRAALQLSEREKIGLMDTALENMPGEVFPLWGWHSDIDKGNRKFLSICTVAGTQAQRAGAIHAMQLIGEKLDIRPKLSRNDFIDDWLSPSNSSKLKVAGLSYLGEFGIPADLVTLKKELDQGNYQTRAAAADAIIKINLRESRKKAIEALYELQPDTIDRRFAAEIFPDDAPIAIDLLEAGVGHPASNVRCRVVGALAKRQELKAATAEKLLNDTEREVRYIAMTSLLKSGRSFAESEAKKLLVRSGPPAGLLFSGSPDTEGEKLFEKFKSEMLAVLSNQQLRERVEQVSSVLDYSAKFALSERFFSSQSESLRASFDDKFKADFDQGLAYVEKQLPAGSEVPAKIKGLEDHLKQEYTRSVLDIFCRKGQGIDLDRVRQVLATGLVTASDLDIEYLGSVGEWEDVELIISLVSRRSAGNSLLMIPSSGLSYELAAKAIHRIAKARFSELVNLTMPDGLLAQIIIGASDKTFRVLSDDAILGLLSVQSENVRKACVLKSARSLNKARLGKLFQQYNGQEATRYYNVVYWLDFALSLPRDVQIPAINRIIDQRWRRAE